MKNNTFKSLILSIIISSIFVPVIAFANENSPSVDGGNTGGAEVIETPSTDGANIGGAEVISSAPSTDGANIGGAEIAPTSQNSNTSNTSYGSGGGSPMISSITYVNNTCPYLNDYLKFGANNPVSEVNKLQSFLKNVEKLDVDINGIFDVKTLEAVKAFQLKYNDRIMAPWGATIPTGNVYITTKQVIDEMYCNTKLALTNDKLIEINNYKNGILKNNTVTNTNTEINNTEIKTNTENSTNTNDNVSTSTINVGQTVDNSSQTAAAVKTSFWSRMWKGIKGIFGSK